MSGRWPRLTCHGLRGRRLPARAWVLVAKLLEALSRAVRRRWRVVLGGVRRLLGWRGGGTAVGCRRRGAWRRLRRRFLRLREGVRLRRRFRLGRRLHGLGLRVRSRDGQLRQRGRVLGARLLVPAAAGCYGERERERDEERFQRSTAGSRRPQWGQSFRSFWTSCSREHPHSLRFSTA
jgi:hypothetical protein